MLIIFKFALYNSYSCMLLAGGTTLIPLIVEQICFFFMVVWTRLNVERKLESWNILVSAFVIIVLSS